MFDNHNNIKVVSTIPPQAVGTTGSANGSTGVAVDRRGYRSVEFVAGYGAVTSATAVFTFVPQHSATSAATGFSDIPAAELLGTAAGAGLAAAARVDGSTEKVTKRVGYIGTKPYVRTKIWAAGTAAAPVHSDVILGRPFNAPVAT